MSHAPVQFSKNFPDGLCSLQGCSFRPMNYPQLGILFSGAYGSPRSYHQKTRRKSRVTLCCQIHESFRRTKYDSDPNPFLWVDTQTTSPRIRVNLPMKRGSVQKKNYFKQIKFKFFQWLRAIVVERLAKLFVSPFSASPHLFCQTLVLDFSVIAMMAITLKSSTKVSKQQGKDREMTWWSKSARIEHV